LGREGKRERKQGTFNSREIERSGEKINKDSMDKGIRGNGRGCTNEVKEESRQVHGKRDKLKAVVKAHLWRRQLEEGKHASVRDLSTKIII
jgi:site-specific DNA recombinase